MCDETVDSDRGSDPLSAPDPTFIQRGLLEAFWQNLRHLADPVDRQEHLLAAEFLASLRSVVVEMMLALNGIRRPSGTVQLNSYLSPQQRKVIEKTLIAPSIESGTWIGQAVALVVIYRWYAPQLVAQYDLRYPQDLERETWQYLQRKLSVWPATIDSD